MAMALRQPTFASSQRRKTVVDESERDLSVIIPERRIDESQEWVLFSPGQARTPAPTQTTNTENTSRTVGLSRVSDFGSFNGIAPSREDEEAVEDDEELDSLDDGLHAFREPSTQFTPRHYDQSGGSILPAHDGLGTFAASSSLVQQQIWNFERNNPGRRRSGRWRRRSSVHQPLDTVGDDDATITENTRTERIEKWRLDQSKILLAEIEKETRRATGRASASTQIEVDNAGRTKNRRENQPETVAGPETPTTAETAYENNISLWQRITQRIIRDFIGIDDSILSVIFGESLPTDKAPPKTSLAASNADTINMDGPRRGWENRLLQRLARELEILLHQISDQPKTPAILPDAKITDYAGIPITRSPNTPSTPDQTSLTNTPPLQESFRFTPTLENYFPPPSPSEHTAQWGIEDPPISTAAATAAAAETAYWEQPPDLATVFSYLHHHFASPSLPTSPLPAVKPPIATATTPDSLRRAAIIRQHHPLVASHRYHHQHQHQHRRRPSLLHYHYSTTPSLKRPGTSCASLSTKKSKREDSSGSRNYWDLGGSGGGSAVATFGIMGAWGEV